MLGRAKWERKKIVRMAMKNFLWRLYCKSSLTHRCNHSFVSMVLAEEMEMRGGANKLTFTTDSTV